MHSQNKQHKVLIVDDNLGVGGKEHQLTLLAKYLPAEWERKVWALDDGPNRENLHSHNVFTLAQPRKWRYDISPAFNLWRIILDWRPDILHAWGWMSCLAAYPLCRILGIPIINGVIRGANKPFRWTQRTGQWLSIKLADGVVANSQAGLKAWGITNKKNKVIYNGFEPKRHKLLQPTKNDHFTVVMVGRMFTEKDFKCFIDAARLISNREGGWRFLAIGHGPERMKLMNYASDLIAKNILEFPQAGSEVIPLINSADIGVLMTAPYTYEGCSNAIMEYMGLNLPVICTRGGGNQEIVIDGQTGFLIPAGDPSALVDRIRFLHENRDLAQKMGEAGYKRFLELFSLERMIGEVVDYYDQFIGQ